MQRNETRRQRYARKLARDLLPVQVASVNFKYEENIAYLIRAAACFGASAVNIIGSCPADSLLRELSGTTSDLIQINRFAAPSDLVRHCRDSDIRLVSAEIADGAVSLHNYSFDFDRTTCIVLGHEQLGVPAEILFNSQVISIPMPGFGYSLNAAQTGNIMLYEYSRQFLATRK